MRKGIDHHKDRSLFYFIRKLAYWEDTVLMCEKKNAITTIHLPCSLHYKSRISDAEG